VVVRKKVQFFLNPDDFVGLQRLAEKTGQSTVSEVIRNALILYSLVAKDVSEGGKLQMVGSDGEVCMYILPGIVNYNIEVS
jgi:hypothetical protein